MLVPDRRNNWEATPGSPENETDRYTCRQGMCGLHAPFHVPHAPIHQLPHLGHAEAVAVGQALGHGLLHLGLAGGGPLAAGEEARKGLGAQGTTQKRLDYESPTTSEHGLLPRTGRGSRKREENTERPSHCGSAGLRRLRGTCAPPSGRPRRSQRPSVPPAAAAGGAAPSSRRMARWLRGGRSCSRTLPLHGPPNCRAIAAPSVLPSMATSPLAPRRQAQRQLGTPVHACQSQGGTGLPLPSPPLAQHPASTCDPGTSQPAVLLPRHGSMPQGCRRPSKPCGGPAVPRPVLPTPVVPCPCPIPVPAPPCLRPVPALSLPRPYPAAQCPRAE